MAHTASSDRSNPPHRTLGPWDVGLATPWLGDAVPCPGQAPSCPLGAPAQVRPSAAVTRAAVPAVALGAWAVVGLGCATGRPAEPEAVRQSARQLESDRKAGPSASSESDTAPEVGRRTSRERVVFSDEPTSVSPSAASVGAQQLAGAGLVDALAASYDDDRRALADMQSLRSATPPRSRQADTPAEEAAALAGPAAGATLRVEPAAAALVEPEVSDQTATPTDAPQTAEPRPAAAAKPPVQSIPAPTPAPTSAPTPAPTVEKPAAAPVLPAIQANAALELPPAVPTDPKELTRLLAESLVRASGESETPLTQWFAFAALAVGNPDLPLPDEFGADLLESERERVRKAHAAFAALGKALQSGTALDKSAQEDLLAALATGPRMSIPKLDLCTRVEAFGRYNAIANRRFLAGANPRFIVYSEVDGFTSALEEGRFVTRLATRVSIETERDGVEVWQRSPEWTGSIDASEVRRGEFFLCEIVQLSEHLSVGGYRLKVQIRDEATGEIAVHALPFHVVADPAMVSVGD